MCACALWTFLTPDLSRDSSGKTPPYLLVSLSVALTVCINLEGGRGCVTAVLRHNPLVLLFWQQWHFAWASRWEKSIKSVRVYVCVSVCLCARTEWCFSCTAPFSSLLCGGPTAVFCSPLVLVGLNKRRQHKKKQKNCQTGSNDKWNAIDLLPAIVFRLSSASATRLIAKTQFSVLMTANRGPNGYYY